MINLRKKFKSFGPLEILVIASVIYLLVMLIWTATTRNGVLEKVNDIKLQKTHVKKSINKSNRTPLNRSRIDTIAGKGSLIEKRFKFLACLETKIRPLLLQLLQPNQ